MADEGTTAWHLQNARERERVVSALADGLTRWRTILEIVEAAESAENALQPLCDEFGLERDHAIALLDTQFRRVSVADRNRIATELADLRSEIARLEADL